ncbi:class E sortase [Arthrobacter gandavensis]|uniref:class E sortase n=1 Tax=Arthrobacter gandavensis TaxID=169960 RepID=UPI0018909B39|nr:class E sortase [Arthrobacter gandavensis]MBF4994591.1 class E sortase [Arthrobacter gandavensis]
MAGKRQPSSGARKRSAGFFAVQVAGELLITLGLILVLFVVWELWWTNIDADRKQEAAMEELYAGFGPVPEVPAGAAPDSYGDPALLPVPESDGITFAAIYIPRFGAEHARPVTQGVGPEVLDSLGLGHYPETAMPGEVGNFALAGHRQTHGQVLDAVDTLMPGDRIYVQTAEGFYTYIFRNSQIVLPDRVDVLAPVPTQPGVVPEERILTLTTCNPRFGSEERFISYAVFESWQPASAGPPAEIAALVTGR